MTCVGRVGVLNDEQTAEWHTVELIMPDSIHVQRLVGRLSE